MNYDDFLLLPIEKFYNDSPLLDLFRFFSIRRCSEKKKIEIFSHFSDVLDSM